MEGLIRLGRGGTVAATDVVAVTSSGAADFGVVVVVLALVDLAAPALAAVAVLGRFVLAAVEPAALVALGRGVVALVVVLVTAPPCFSADRAGARLGAGAFLAAALVARVAGGRGARTLGAVARGSSVDIPVRPSDGCTGSVRPEAIASVLLDSSLVDPRPPMRRS